MTSYPQPLSIESNATEAGAVSWAAVLAGAIAATALSLILLILGTGLGLSSVSTWSFNGVSAGTFGIAAIGWITFTQLAASALGGYLAGRLRAKWVAVHSDEAYFRDTAHGFLAWAVASLVTAAVLGSATGAIVNSGVQAGATVASTAVTGATGMAAASASQSDASPADVSSYFVDALFRKDSVAPSTPGSTSTVVTDAANSPTPVSEIGRIFVSSMRAGSLPADDVRYVGQLVSQRTGLSQADAEKRVSDNFARLQAKLTEAQTAAKTAADKTRKATAYAALWIFISLLIGAFMASLAALYGGRHRDLQMPAATPVR